MNKKTKELSFCSFYEEDIFKFYSDDYYYFAFAESKIRFLFISSILMRSKPYTLKLKNIYDGGYTIKNKEILKIFPNYEIVRINKYFEGIFIVSCYKFNGLVFLNVTNKNKFTLIKLAKRLRKFDNLMVGFFIYEENKLIEYAYFYDLMNELVLEAQQKYIFLDFLDIKINKINQKLKKDKHYIRNKK